MSSMTKEELDARIKSDPVFKEAFQMELAKTVLTVIATCSDNSTISGMRELAKSCLEELNR